jgi:hypothetical protein
MIPKRPSKDSIDEILNTVQKRSRKPVKMSADMRIDSVKRIS